MRLSTIPAFLCAQGVLLLLLPVARGQTTSTGTTTTAGTGTCSGTVNGKTISGKTMLSLGGDYVELNTGPSGAQEAGCGSSGSVDLVQQNVGTVFGKAECECHGRGFNLRVVLDSVIASDGQAYNSAMWVGQDNCSDQTQRTTNGARCEQITNQNPPDNTRFDIRAQEFRIAGTPIDISLPAEALVTQRPVGTAAAGWTYSCNSGGPQNVTAQVLLGPDSSPATCKLPLVINTEGPTVPSVTSVDSGNRGLSVNWSVQEGASGVVFYQLLCRKKSDPSQPVMSSEFLASTRHYFSACIDGKLYRRPFNADNTNSVEDHPGLGEKPTPGQFLVDPRFICSDRITAATTENSARISGLENNQEYEVLVVSIDAYGNATPSAIATGTPLATKGFSDDSAFSQSSDRPTGFGCQGSGQRTSTRAPLFVGGFLLLFGFLRKRLRRAQ